MKIFQYRKVGLSNRAQQKSVMIIVKVNGSFMVCSMKFTFLLLFSSIRLGDRKHLNDVKKHTQDFYKDLPVTIEDIRQK